MVLCDETSFCYDDGTKGECVKSCFDYPILANSTCNCNNTITCLENDVCMLTEKGTECVTFPKCEDMTIVTDDHCACLENMTACQVKEYCHKTDSACKPAPPKCPPIPDIAPQIGCSCNITVCIEGKMCDNKTNTCIDRPEPCEKMPMLAGAEKCYCKEAHEICEEGFMCNLYNNTCTLPPPDCGPVPDIATEERCVCKKKKICKEGQMCEDNGKCKKRPDACPAIPEVSARGGCYCTVDHSLCLEEEMCDNRTAIAKCAKRPPECPPMPGVTYGVTGCYCRFSDSICEEIHMCNERNNSCSIPAMCKDPVLFPDWEDMNLKIVSNYNESTLIEGSNLTFRCKKNTFLTEVKI